MSDEIETIRQVLDRGDLRSLVSQLEQRAFCYESPSDFRAGVEAMARHLEDRLQSSSTSAERTA